MKKLITTILLSCVVTFVMAQVTLKKVPVTVQSNLNGTEKINIPFPQNPLLHDNGGWEKGPSAWKSASAVPVEYRAGLLFLDRLGNGLVKYIPVEIKFKTAGSIDVSANSMPGTKAGANGWTRINGQAGQTVKATIITKEADFGLAVVLFLRNFNAYKRNPVN